MGTISKNFDFIEFSYSEIAQHNDICNAIVDTNVRDAIVALVDAVLQPLRDRVGKPLHINSGYRCKELNEIVGGVKTSQHIKGEAADVAYDKPIELARAALGLPFDQMIIYPTFVHFSHKLKGEQRGQILYNKLYKGKKL